MNPKSASALSWFALIVNVFGLTATALSAQFIFSALAVVLAIIPAIFARKGSQIFGVAVLVVSLTLVMTGYPNYNKERGGSEQRAKARSGNALVPPAAKQEEHK